MANTYLREISQIAPNLFLSGACAVTEANVKALNIRTVVNVTKELQADPGLGEDVRLVRIPVEDSAGANLYCYFEELSTLLRDCEEKDENALVHCVAGVSRSASVCLAYLVRHRHMSLVDAFAHLRNKRPIVRPNRGFATQLLKWEEACTSDEGVAASKGLLMADVVHCHEDLSRAV